MDRYHMVFRPSRQRQHHLAVLVVHHARKSAGRMRAAPTSVNERLTALAHAGPLAPVEVCSSSAADFFTRFI